MLMLWLSTLFVGLLHAVAPDHWLPFVMIARAKNWPLRKLLGLTLLAGLGHTASASLIGAVGLLLGVALQTVAFWESQRGHIASLLLIGFGIAYMVHGLKKLGNEHAHSHPVHDGITYWTLFAVIVFGPCEPLIPLLFTSYVYGWHAVVYVFILFTVSTIGMMLFQVWLVSLGVSHLRWRLMERAGDALAGGIIALTGMLVAILGL
ncbi:MAG: sulfite exporter TauE/SafE family protein [bacterium JZ-2024 1]